MLGLSALYLPILLSAVMVFIASSVIHMFLVAWHRGDYGQMPNEDKVMDALRPFSIPPGDYFVPRPPNMAEMRSPAFAEKVKKGPVFVITVMQNRMVMMGKNLALWFAYSLVIGLFSGYIAGRALPAGANYLQVFRFVGATAFLGYTAALWQMSIWFQRSWVTTIKSTIDGLLYALLTAGTFGWLWPR